ncbi:MAG TPA: manganese efflux pump MntP family protein [Sumerlaeia bacterium]|nr:manganese efflux pump MntP family protein [Sumerlaeia bacterium]
MFSFIDILLIAVSLSADAFFTTLGVVGAKPIRRQTFRLSFHFGLFQGLMPCLGWLAGKSVAGFLDRIDHWIAFAILAAIALNMIREAAHPRTRQSPGDRSRGWSLVTLSLATSMDAFSVGVVFGVVGQSILYPCFVIACVTGALTFIAARLGRRIKSRLGVQAEIAGAVLLLIVAFRMLLM